MGERSERREGTPRASERRMLGAATDLDLLKMETEEGGCKARKAFAPTDPTRPPRPLAKQNALRSYHIFYRHPCAHSSYSSRFPTMSSANINVKTTITALLDKACKVVDIRL